MENEPVKFGAGALAAMVRVGGKEFGKLLPAFPDSFQPIEEPGLPGNLTPQEVLSQKQSPEPELEM
jgi:hypothetical protein